jgi:hypothetical protein
MVRANCANTNAENPRPSFIPSASRRPTFNAPFPAAGGGMGCPLALGPAEGTRDGGGRVGVGGAALASGADPQTGPRRCAHA